LVCGQFGPTTLVSGALNIWSLVVCGDLWWSVVIQDS